MPHDLATDAADHLIVNVDMNINVDMNVNMDMHVILVTTIPVLSTLRNQQTHTYKHKTESHRLWRLLRRRL